MRLPRSRIIQTSANRRSSVKLRQTLIGKSWRIIMDRDLNPAKAVGVSDRVIAVSGAPKTANSSGPAVARRNIWAPS